MAVLQERVIKGRKSLRNTSINDEDVKLVLKCLFYMKNAASEEAIITGTEPDPSKRAEEVYVL